MRLLDRMDWSKILWFFLEILYSFNLPWMQCVNGAIGPLCWKASLSRSIQRLTSFLVYRADDGVGEFGGACFAADVVGGVFCLAIDFFEGGLDAASRGAFVEVI